MVPIVEAIVILVMSFNVRYYNPDDGNNHWDNRKANVLEIIQKYSPDLLGVQEALSNQLNYLDKELSEYDYFGKSRDGSKESEYCSIFYKSNKFELIDSNTFWLSETPDEPSKGWDAAFNRIVTWGKFKNKDADKIFYLFNTHFDHRGEEAKQKSVELLKNKISEIAGDEDYIVTGDFNFEPSSKFYAELTEGSTAELGDAAKLSKNEVDKNKGTFNAFDPEQKPIGPIDYIFVSPEISVTNYKVIDTAFDGKYPSDHFPLIAELKLESK